MSNELTRRALLAMSAVLAAGASLPSLGAVQTAEGHMRNMMEVPPNAPKVAMLIYPKMVALDLIGPMSVFKILRCDVQLVWKEKIAVSTDVGIPFTATQTFDECPQDEIGRASCRERV